MAEMSVMGSPSKAAMSASLPFSMEPTWSSFLISWDAVLVAAVSACTGVIPCLHISSNS